MHGRLLFIVFLEQFSITFEEPHFTGSALSWGRKVVRECTGADKEFQSINIRNSPLFFATLQILFSILTYNVFFGASEIA